MNEIQRIESAIKRTENSGEEISEIMFMPLKEFLTQRIISAISSSDRLTRTIGTRVSKRWSEIGLDHQKRVVNLLSNKF